MINGVDVGALLGIARAIRSDAGLAKFNFRAVNRWMGGDKTRSAIKEFSGAGQEHRANAPGFFVDSGEPPVLLGEDRAPNAGEFLLHTLIACITTSVVYHAAANAIEIDAIESEIDGDIDLRGFLGLSADVRKGYNNIHVRMRVKTRATAARIKELASMSPMLEMISKAAPITLDIVTY
jgi:uncharacterized OsmC-like protein